MSNNQNQGAKCEHCKDTGFRIGSVKCPYCTGNQGASIEADHLAAIEEAAQVLESAAVHNRSKGRTVLENTQQDRASRLRAAHAFLAARRSVPPAAGGLPPLPEPDVIAYTCIGDNDAYSPMLVKRIVADAIAADRAQRKQAGQEGGAA